MEAREAVEKVEHWLRSGTSADLTDGEHAVRVDHENVVRVPEGWYVPYDSVRSLDTGDRLAALVPQPALVVRADGALRRPDLGPEGRLPSVPVAMAGAADWQEILEPEFEHSGVAYLGVPRSAVLAWRKYTDGEPTDEVRVNPEYQQGPERLGYPPMDTPLEHLLSYAATGRYERAQYLSGLLGAEVLIPLDPYTGQPLERQWEEGRTLLRVYSSRRRLPVGTARWSRAEVLSVIEDFPGTGLLINPGSFPSDRLDAGELAATRAAWPLFRKSPPVVEVSPEYSEWVAETGRLVAERFGLDEPLAGLREAMAKARAAGFELSEVECERFVVGRAWERRNGVRPDGVDSPGEDRSGRQWPEDLTANGLVARYDALGRVRPHAGSSGKFSRRDADEAGFQWHRVTGAFVGFAMGESLGLAVDTLSTPEIQARFGDGLLDRVGRPGPLTEQLLFHTEGLLRALPAPVTPALRTVGVRALRRWRETGGDDGWLTRVAELRDRTPLPAGPGDDVSFLVPGLAAALCGGAPDSDEKTAAEAGRLLAAGAGADEPTADAAAALAELFARLFRRADPAYPPHIHVQRQLDVGTVSGPVAGAFAGALRARVELIRPDHEELDAAGTGQSAVDAVGRTMIAVFRRFFDPRWTLVSAVGHSGRSAITGALAGAMLGARYGIPSLPADWLHQLELRDLTETVADDAFWHFSAHPPLADSRYAAEWAARYPRDVS
ncbi:YrhB domain-containing protein [Amycolatopsis sp. NPDC059027]|uniref:YrhB domain-containing protein n=1 Tax=unclassified Amycolatopsis TaxID=2618356 RepID=UPI00366A9D16